MPELTVVVLAAGGGTRMKSKTAKVLHPIAGRSMVGHVLSAVAAVEPTRLVAVVGHQREQVAPHIQQLAPSAVIAVQETLDGTGGAVSAALAALQAAGAPALSGTVLVTTGDTPLLEGATLQALVAEHEAAHDAAGRAVTVLTGEVPDPHGYGRIVRDPDGSVRAIREQKEITEAEEEAIREINSGILAFDAEFLVDALPRLTADNAKNERYLTDTVALARADGREVGAHLTDDVEQTEGANDRAQLAKLGRLKNERILRHWMAEGVTVMDPATTWVEADVSLAPDVTLLPGVQLIGACSVAEDAVIGPDCTLKDTEIGAGARVVRTHGELAVIGPRAEVGPFSYLRPGATIDEGGKAGAFVEVKNARIGRGAKVPHLSYVGDAEIGEGSNIGAGTIFANYDGVTKNRTVIGKHVKTGSDNVFVAPVRVGDGAATGAGSVVRRDVPPGALAVTTGQQRHIDGWVFRKREGTPAADAAREALAQSSVAEAGSTRPTGPAAPTGGEPST